MLILVGVFFDELCGGDLMVRISTSRWMLAHSWASNPLNSLGIVLFGACVFSGIYLEVNTRVDEEDEE
jgi:hypothetical protein